MVKLLLEKGAELECRDILGKTPLDWAIENKHEKVVKLLLEKGAEVDSKDRYGQTPLSLAVRKGHEAVIKLLLEKGAEMESEDKEWGQTLLSYAAERGLKLLLEKGAELESEDKSGQTPLSWAAEHGHEAVEANSLSDTDSARDSMEGSSNLMLSSRTSLVDTLGSQNQVEPEVATPKSHHDIDDDVESLASDIEDIGSHRSISRTPQVITAEHHLAIVLAQHSQLTSLHKKALSKIGVGRFIENLRRLLKQYYLDLRPTADTNLKRASIDILKNRWSRYRIAQQIVEIYRPDTEESQTKMPKPEDREERMSRLEQWIVKNQAFSPEAHYSERVRSVEQGAETTVQHWENASSSEEMDSESESYAAKPWPNVAEMENFIVGGNAFQNLIANFQVFLLPRDLRTQVTRALMCIPKEDRWFSPEEDLSFQNKFKIFAESITEQDWDWWPFRTKMRPLKKNETRLHWHCVSTPPVQTNITRYSHNYSIVISISG